jgi:hypothetical protein
MDTQMENSLSAGLHFHEELLLDRAAMLAMRAMLAMQPAVDFGPGGRADFDSLMEKTPSADGVTYEDVFPANVSLLRAARSALDMIGGFLRQHLGVHQDTTA